jgi:hypothetical protein
MPLNASEKGQIAQSFLKCFGEDVYWCGRTLRFVSLYTNNNVNLLADVQNAATTWQPFIDSGLSIEWWKTELARNYNETVTT